jgi:hypothetical protein
MVNGIKTIKEWFAKLLSSRRQAPTTQVSSAKELRIVNAGMSDTRLQALEGQGYRQCYMEKLREVATTPEPETQERWFSDNPSEPANTIEVEVKKRQTRIKQAQARMSHTRLQALVQQMSPEELELNDSEATRLSGTNYKPIRP